MDAVKCVMRWQRWVVSGPGETVSRVLSVLDAHLPIGWKRLSGDELLPVQSFVRPGDAWYALEPTPSHAGASLSLVRTLESQLRGGYVVWPVNPSNPGNPSLIQAGWGEVITFLKRGIVPAAKSVGATVRAPTFEEIFLDDLPWEVQDRLREFSRAARKSLPLDRSEAALWHDFVIAAFRTRAVIDDQGFTDWLVADGWPREHAAEFYDRLIDHSLLLARYKEELLEV